MTDLIEDFEGWLRDADKSKQTLRIYVGALGRFGIWFEQSNRAPLTVEALTPTDLRLYRDHLVQAKLKSSSINAWACCVWCFRGMACPTTPSPAS